MNAEVFGLKEMRDERFLATAFYFAYFLTTLSGLFSRFVWRCGRELNESGFHILQEEVFFKGPDQSLCV